MSSCGAEARTRKDFPRFSQRQGRHLFMKDLAERARETKKKGKEAKLRREEWRPPWH